MHERKTKYRLITITIAAAILGAAAAHYFPAQRLRTHVVSAPAPSAAPLVAKAPAPAPLPFGHPYYPYSVIPGGAHSRQELEDRLRADGVVAKHYSDFRTADARIIELDEDRQYYVSYRVGDKIYWTRRAITLRRGEKLLFDGVHYARARCGNRLTLVPLKPQIETAEFEPTPKVFNAPVAVQVSLTPQVALEPGPALPFIASARLDEAASPLDNLMDPFLASGAAPPPEMIDYVPTRHDRATLFALDGTTPLAMLPIFYPNSSPVSPVPEPSVAGLICFILASLALALAWKARSRFTAR